MRVLALLLAVAAGCYDPSIDDCQFRCSPPAMDCPDGSDCVDGFCRTASGACANDGCANAPAPPNNCGNPFALLDVGGCGVVCTSNRPHDDVQSSCGPNWRAGILDSRTELDLVPVTTGRYWVGAERVAGGFQWFTGAPVDPSAWDTSFPSGSGSSCVYLDGMRHRLRNDRSCEDDNNYVCTIPATN